MSEEKAVRSSSFPEWLNQQLLQRGWTQGKLIAASGSTKEERLSSAAVSRYSTGKMLPDAASCRKIAYAFDLPVELVLRKAGLIDTPFSGEPDWLQRAIDDLAYAVAVGQLSEEGRLALAAHIHREQLLQGLERKKAVPVIQSSQAAGTAVDTTTKTQLAVVKSVEELKQALVTRWGGHETNTQNNTIQDRLNQIEQEISNQRQVLSLFRGPERLERQYVLFGYYLLAVDVARDGRKYQAAFRNAESALELALSLNVPEVRHPELVTAAYMARGSVYSDLGTREGLEAAVADLRAGLSYAQRSQTPLHATYAAVAGATLIVLAQDKQDRAEAFSLTDRAGKLVGTGELKKTLYYLNPLTEEWTRNLRALAFIQGKKDTAEAFSALDDNYDKIPADSHLLACNHLYRARAEEIQGHYPYATELAGFALDLFETLKSQAGIFGVGKVVNTLSQHDNYADSVELAQLRARLIGRKRRRLLVLEEE